MYTTQPVFLIIDLFCGAGGTTTGFIQAMANGTNAAKVIACVNHDPKAIKSHWMNYPEVKHYEEDIRTLNLTGLIKLVNEERNKYPAAYLVLWASLECTNFSKAKGGLPRDADSRTLADHLERYVEALNPDYIQIENVVEFMSWGPLDANGKPESRKNGSDWLRWRKNICQNHNYIDEWKELNSANFGAYTSRNRLFGCFAKPWLPIVWPQPTHAKKPVKEGMYGDLQKWMPVKDVLNFSDEGESIFTRPKPLSEKTLERIYAGLVKYIAKGDTAFISKYFSGRPAGKVNSINDPASTITAFGGQTLVQPEFIVQRNNGNPNSKLVDIDGPARTITTTGGNQELVQPIFIVTSNGGLPTSKSYSVDNPSRVITTSDNQALVQPEFLVKYNSMSKNGNYNPPSIDEPAPVISTQNRIYLAKAEFLQHYYGNGFSSSTNEPCPTLRAKAGQALIQSEFFIDKHLNSTQNQSIDQPAGTVMPTDKHRLVEAVPFIMPTSYDNMPQSIDDPLPVITANRKHHYIINPAWGGNPGSIEEPCCVVVARQDKAPLYFVQVESGSVKHAVYDEDSICSIKIKQFMAAYGLVDIKMRMLRVHELLLIQGFPSGYQLSGNQADQKKFIGNSVVPHVVRFWCEEMATRLIEINKKHKVA